MKPFDDYPAEAPEQKQKSLKAERIAVLLKIYTHPLITLRGMHYIIFSD